MPDQRSSKGKGKSFRDMSPAWQAKQKEKAAVNRRAVSDVRDYLSKCWGIEVKDKGRGRLDVRAIYNEERLGEVAMYWPATGSWRVKGAEQRMRKSDSVEDFLDQFAQGAERPDEQIGLHGMDKDVVVRNARRTELRLQELHQSEPPKGADRSRPLTEEAVASPAGSRPRSAPRKQRPQVSRETPPEPAALAAEEPISPVRLPSEDYAVEVVSRLRRANLLSDMGAQSWQMYLRKERKSGWVLDSDAVLLLAHICKWYTPSRSDDQRPRFTGESLLLSTKYISGLLGMKSTAVNDLLARLDGYGVIRRVAEPRGNQYFEGGGANRHIYLVAEQLEAITHAANVDPSTGVMERAAPDFRSPYIEPVPRTSVGGIDDDGGRESGRTGRNERQGSSVGGGVDATAAPLISGRSRELRDQDDDTDDRGVGSASHTLTRSASHDAVQRQWDDPADEWGTNRRAATGPSARAENVRRLWMLRTLFDGQVYHAHQEYEAIWRGRSALSHELRTVPGHLVADLQDEMRKSAAKRERAVLTEQWSIVTGLTEADLSDEIFNAHRRLKHRAAKELVAAAVAVCGCLDEPDWSYAASVEQYRKEVRWLVKNVGRESFNQWVEGADQAPYVVRATLVEAAAHGLNSVELRRRLGDAIRVSHRRRSRGRGKGAAYSARPEWLGRYVGLLWGAEGLSIDLAYLGRRAKVDACAEAFAYAAGKETFTLRSFTWHLRYRGLDRQVTLSEEREAVWSKLRWLARRADPRGGWPDED